MLRFYYHPISANARRVWVALLEKQIPFEPILIQLNGDQFQPEFLAVSPFHHVPVIVDQGFRVLESLAILDYLEAAFPQRPLMPKTAQSIAKVRMVEMVTVNELQPALIPLMKQQMQLEVPGSAVESAHQRIQTTLAFLESLLGVQRYFVEDGFTRADIVAGTLVPNLPMLGISLNSYPSLLQWIAYLNSRSSWQTTAIAPADLQAAIPNMKAILQRLS